MHESDDTDRREESEIEVGFVSRSDDGTVRFVEQGQEGLECYIWVQLQ